MEITGVMVDALCGLQNRVEFGTIMVWYFIADRTTIVGQGSKVNKPLPPGNPSCL
jgi:hypothetical protein